MGGKENGSDVSDIISQTTMKSGDISKITISEGECISLIINTEIELTKEWELSEVLWTADVDTMRSKDL